MNSADRKDTYKIKADFCDSDLTEAWYRFEGEAGTRMPTTYVEKYRCGTSFPGWLNGNHPTVADGEVDRQVCFHKYEDRCQEYHQIKVKNCTSYHVYKLISTLGCPLRYCGTD